jgi:hypothetical protein
MCNLYSMTKGQQAIRELARVMVDSTGNLPPLPGIFPDYPAPIVRTVAGVRECLAVIFPNLRQIRIMAHAAGRA